MDKISNDLQSHQPDSLYKKNPTVLLVTKINSINAKNYNQFVYTIQFNIKEQKTNA